MVEMDHSVLGMSAKKHALILSGVFGFFFVVLFAIEIWKLPGQFELWLAVGAKLAGLAIVTPMFLCLGSVALLCLLKCNAKVLVIICIFWPVSIAITMIVLLISGFEEAAGLPDPLGPYAIIGCSVILLLGSIHCIILLFTLGFCARGGGRIDADLYDLEKSDSQKESGSSSETEKKSNQ